MKDWKSTFPAKGLAPVFRMRVHGYIERIEAGDASAARRALRGWDMDLSFEGVPAEVLRQTGAEMNTALSYMKSDPPDSDLAVATLRRVLALWG